MSFSSTITLSTQVLKSVGAGQFSQPEIVGCGKKIWFPFPRPVPRPILQFVYSHAF